MNSIESESSKQHVATQQTRTPVNQPAALLACHHAPAVMYFESYENRSPASAGVPHGTRWYTQSVQMGRHMVASPVQRILHTSPSTRAMPFVAGFRVPHLFIHHYVLGFKARLGVFATPLAATTLTYISL
jgi:hypothetical protein